MTSPATSPAPDLCVSVAGIQLKNPVIAASGTFGYGVEFEDVVHLDKLGGFVVKGLSAEPMTGNPPPRLYETPAGMLNAIGLQNIGARAFIDEKLPKLRKMKNIVVFANVFGYTPRRLRAHDRDPERRRGNRRVRTERVLPEHGSTAASSLAAIRARSMKSSIQPSGFRAGR